MTQDKLWQQKYKAIVAFMATYRRNPAKHRIEEHLKQSLIKHNRKLLNAGKMKAERGEKFNELLALEEKYRRQNQF